MVFPAPDLALALSACAHCSSVLLQKTFQLFLSLLVHFLLKIVYFFPNNLEVASPHQTSTARCCHRCRSPYRSLLPSERHRSCELKTCKNDLGHLEVLDSLQSQMEFCFCNDCLWFRYFQPLKMEGGSVVCCTNWQISGRSRWPEKFYPPIDSGKHSLSGNTDVHRGEAFQGQCLGWDGPWMLWQIANCATLLSSSLHTNSLPSSVNVHV